MGTFITMRTSTKVNNDATNTQITLYDVKWRRPDDPEVLECHGLTAELLVFRIRAVLRMCGSVELLELRQVRRRNK